MRSLNARAGENACLAIARGCRDCCIKIPFVDVTHVFKNILNSAGCGVVAAGIGVWIRRPEGRASSPGSNPMRIVYALVVSEAKIIAISQVHLDDYCFDDDL